MCLSYLFTFISFPNPFLSLRTCRCRVDIIVIWFPILVKLRAVSGGWLLSAGAVIVCFVLAGQSRMTEAGLA